MGRQKWDYRAPDAVFVTVKSLVPNHREKEGSL
jgi:hypothetical protein